MHRRSRAPSILSVASLLCLVCCADLISAASGEANVTWISPSEGDAYGSGDTIVGRWSCDKPVVSPSFRICMTDDGSQVTSQRRDDDTGDDGSETTDSGGSCGGAVWPTIQQSDGSYFIHLSLPNVTSSAQCYLEMVDDFGDKMASPTFSFGGAASADDDEASPATSESASLSAAGPSATANTTTSRIPVSPQMLPQSLDESHVPVPTAAYAVPLSLVGSVILAAGGLSFHQRRKLKTERLQEQASLKTRRALSRRSTLSFAGFVNLGVGAHPKAHDAQPESRSTSVGGRMRAWRRDISRHGGRDRRPQIHDFGSRTSEATLAWHAHPDEPEGNSVRGFTALPRRSEPRRPTREPFYAGQRSGARRTMVPAGAFRTGVSPVFPSTDSWGGEDEDDAHGLRKARDASADYDYDDEAEWGRLKRQGRTLEDPGAVDPARRGGDAYLNASVNDSVMDRYFNTSPIPRLPDDVPGVSPSISRPERLHVRRYADPGGEEKALPPAPRDAERDLYDIVAKRISRDSQV